MSPFSLELLIRCEKAYHTTHVDITVIVVAVVVVAVVVVAVVVVAVVVVAVVVVENVSLPHSKRLTLI